MTINSITDNNTPQSTQTTQQVSIALSDETVELLEFLANSQGISQDEAIRRAITTDVYFLKEHLEGSKVLLQKLGSVRSIVLQSHPKREIQDWIVSTKVRSHGGIAIALVVFFGVSLLAEFVLIALGAFYPQSNSAIIKDTLPLLTNSLTSIVFLTLALYYKDN